MLSQKLVMLIEDHADQLTAGLIDELQRHPRTGGYHQLSRSELHQRAYDVYRNLGQWLLGKSEREIEASYTDLATRRLREGIALSNVICALTLTKNHLIDYVKRAGLANTALDLYAELELVRAVSQFFDKAIYYTAYGYEQVAPKEQAGSSPLIRAR